MKKLEFYEPAMCCDTGICGPSVDPELLRMTSIIEDIVKAGGDVSRHNLKSEPGAFVTSEIVARILKDQGVDSLPITLINGEVIATGSYPSNTRLSELLGIELGSVPEPAAKEDSTGCCSSEPPQAQTSCCGSTESAFGKGSCC